MQFALQLQQDHREREIDNIGLLRAFSSHIMVKKSCFYCVYICYERNMHTLGAGDDQIVIAESLIMNI